MRRGDRVDDRWPLVDGGHLEASGGIRHAAKAAQFSCAEGFHEAGSSGKIGFPRHQARLSGCRRESWIAKND
jgi:hypothetical protein